MIEFELGKLRFLLYIFHPSHELSVAFKLDFLGLGRTIYECLEVFGISLFLSVHFLLFGIDLFLSLFFCLGLCECLGHHGINHFLHLSILQRGLGRFCDGSVLLGINHLNLDLFCRGFGLDSDGLLLFDGLVLLSINLVLNSNYLLS